ncbi:hypothetical protein SORBI_3001G532600 [Sorghum bicolor]|uniref:pyridoxal 5'-phosphate synthase n=1 Tax=Sorghum bicolor TaxID=4558 RepID=A0A1Z5SBU2_SORBI|nr:hypothetical protein SORBI_3001G532600 [Sorghum bicolor]
MAGGGAAASALSSPWRTLLQRALDANAHLRHSTFFQLATVGACGRPANRTVVFRGFQEHCDKIQINTDARSNKIGEIKSCPFGEICWYFTDSWEQFRISGSIDVIDASSADPAKLQVDYLNLKSNQRLMFTRQNDDGSNDWMAVKVSP